MVHVTLWHPQPKFTMHKIWVCIKRYQPNLHNETQTDKDGCPLRKVTGKLQSQRHFCYEQVVAVVGDHSYLDVFVIMSKVR